MRQIHPPSTPSTPSTLAEAHLGGGLPTESPAEDRDRRLLVVDGVDGSGAHTDQHLSVEKRLEKKIVRFTVAFPASADRKEVEKCRKVG